MQTQATMVLTAIVVLACSGLPACLLSSRSSVGQRAATALMVVGSVLGLGGIAMSFGQATPPSLHVPWLLPWGRFAIAIDSLSAFFLVPVFVVPALGSIYGLGYWKQAEHPDNGQRLGVFYGLLAAAMAMVVVARDGVLFLIAWEVMAITAYFAATVDDESPDVRRAGWVYLISTHVGTLSLIAMFALWRHATGSPALEPAQGLPSSVAGTIFLLALIGFGLKAGLMPLHVWLPGAHANAPTHVSAVMSGVMLKMGVYGIARMTALFPTTAEWWGGLLLVAGGISGVAGIAFAIGQQDVKRLLAYSSIENIGIIAMALGLALLGRSLGRPDWVVLGLGGSLLHVWNHALFKSLLFFNAGAVIHAVHTRDMDRMGGLAGRMPRVTALFVVGALAICALPPLNGFVSEWLLYIGLFRTLGSASEVGAHVPVVAAAAVALAMIGALAVACFVKLLGTVFLGSPRGSSGDHAHDAPATMIGPMVVLAVGCASIGLFPTIVTPLLEDAVSVWAVLPAPTVSVAAVAPLEWITAVGLGLLVLVAMIVLAVHTLPRANVVGESDTWGCGYAQPTARMQYTGASFGQMLVSLFTFILWPKTHRPAIRGLFARPAHFKSVAPDTVLDRLVQPAFRVAGRYLPTLRVLQQGQTQLYVLYVLAIMVVLLVWGALGAQP